MTEKEFLSKFKKQFKKYFPNAFYYKIPDTGGTGGMRPFDVIAIVNNVTICIEAKRSCKLKPTEYQHHNLQLAENNGATSIVLNPENADYWLHKIKEKVYGTSDAGRIGPVG